MSASWLRLADLGRLAAAGASVDDLVRALAEPVDEGPRPLPSTSLKTEAEAARGDKYRFRRKPKILKSVPAVRGGVCG